MNDTDLKLIAEFLEENYSLFQDFLEQEEIESTEAESMIDELKNNRKSKCPTQ